MTAYGFRISTEIQKFQYFDTLEGLRAEIYRTREDKGDPHGGNIRVSIVLYPLYPGDDADIEFMDAVIKSSLRAFWQILNFENPPTNQKVMSRFDTAVYFSL